MVGKNASQDHILGVSLDIGTTVFSTSFHSIIVIFISLFVSSQSLAQNTDTLSSSGEGILISLPLGLEAKDYYIPEDNPQSADKIELGRLLFFDKRLSVDNTVACASCHSPAKAFTDNLPVSLGINNEQGSRNAPTVINRVSETLHFWDGRAQSLEDQAKGPLTNPLEMGMPDLETVSRKIASIEGYRNWFMRVFNRAVNIDDIARAIASFERTVVSGNSRWDQFKAGNSLALTEAERRGLEIFENKGRCSQCHTGWNLTDEKYHNIGIDWDTSRIDLGRYAVTGETKDIGAFKTPTLREIALTAPYMHDGRFSTLRQVVDYYNFNIIANPYLDPELQRPILSLLETLEFYSESNEPDSSGSLTMKNINLTMQEERDLVAFLRTLSGEGWQNIEPPDTFPN